MSTEGRVRCSLVGGGRKNSPSFFYERKREKWCSGALTGELTRVRSYRILKEGGPPPPTGKEEKEQEGGTSSGRSAFWAIRPLSTGGGKREREDS